MKHKICGRVTAALLAAMCLTAAPVSAQTYCAPGGTGDGTAPSKAAENVANAEGTVKLKSGGAYEGFEAESGKTVDVLTYGEGEKPTISGKIDVKGSAHISGVSMSGGLTITGTAVIEDCVISGETDIKDSASVIIKNCELKNKIKISGSGSSEIYNNSCEPGGGCLIEADGSADISFFGNTVIGGALINTAQAYSGRVSFLSNSAQLSDSAQATQKPLFSFSGLKENDRSRVVGNSISGKGEMFKLDGLSNAELPKIFGNSYADSFSASDGEKAFSSLDDWEIYGLSDGDRAAADGEKPTVTDIRSTRDENGAALSWKGGETAIIYNIYRGSGDAFDESKLIASTENEEYTDKTVYDNSDAVYFVVAKASDGTLGDPAAVKTSAIKSKAAFDNESSIFKCDFETGIDEWEKRNYSIEQSGDVSHSGGHSLRVKVNSSFLKGTGNHTAACENGVHTSKCYNSNCDTYYVYPKENLKDGDKYNLSAWVYTTLDNVQFMMTEWRTYNGGYSKLKPNEWNYVELTGTYKYKNNPDHDSNNFRFRFLKTDAEEDGIFYIDDVMMKPADAEYDGSTVEKISFTNGDGTEASALPSDWLVARYDADMKSEDFAGFTAVLKLFDADGNILCEKRETFGSERGVSGEKTFTLEADMTKYADAVRAEAYCTEGGGEVLKSASITKSTE